MSTTINLQPTDSCYCKSKNSTISTTTESVYVYCSIATSDSDGNTTYTGSTTVTFTKGTIVSVSSTTATVKKESATTYTVTAYNTLSGRKQVSVTVNYYAKNPVYIIKNGSGTAMWRRQFQKSVSSLSNCIVYYSKKAYGASTWTTSTTTSATTLNTQLSNVLAGDNFAFYVQANYGYIYNPGISGQTTSTDIWTMNKTVANLSDSDFSKSAYSPTVSTFSAPTSVSATLSNGQIKVQVYNPNSLGQFKVEYMVFQDGEVYRASGYGGYYYNAGSSLGVKKKSTDYFWIEEDDDGNSFESTVGYKIDVRFIQSHTGSRGSYTTNFTEWSNSTSVEINGYTSETTTA